MPYKNKDLQKQFQREWVAKKKAKFFASLSCEKCGNSNELNLSSNVPGVRIHTMSPWNKSGVPRENYKVLCSGCKNVPKPIKKRRRKTIAKSNITEARKMAIKAQKMLQERREKNTIQTPTHQS